MTTDPRILVVIPSYNHGNFIEARVRSVLDQTAGDLDIWLIDDTSNDHTMEVLQSITDSRLTISQRPSNSGSPFSAWIEACDMLREGRHDYIWIAESDDRAASDFLSNALFELESNPRSVLYFTHSWYVDERDLIIGHSINYLKKNFSMIDWSRLQTFNGDEFLTSCLLRGMAVPNMSSALMRADAFCASVEPHYRKYRLAADWIFAIALSLRGEVIFDPRDSNYFRHHPRTARSEAKMARVLVEHMSATHAAFATGRCDANDYRLQMQNWNKMYRHEKVNRNEFIKILKFLNPELVDEFITYISD